jgi:hypothetical protein
MSDTSVTEDNFWSERRSFQKKSMKEAGSSLKWKCGISLAVSILVRLFFAYIAIPATVMFLIFLFESNSEGLASTLNSIFIGHTEAITEITAKNLVHYHHFVAVFIFMVTWMVPWVSPARRQVNSEMDRWWSRNGSKLPVTAPENR